MAENYKFVNYAGAEMAELFNKMADLDVATQSKAGLMSATDKTKLDELPAGAQENVLEGVQLAGADLTVTEKKVNIPVDNAPTEGSSALIRSGAVYTAGYAIKEELSQLGQEVGKTENMTVHIGSNGESGVIMYKIGEDIDPGFVFNGESIIEESSSITLYIYTSADYSTYISKSIVSGTTYNSIRTKFNNYTGIIYGFFVYITHATAGNGTLVLEFPKLKDSINDLSDSVNVLSQREDELVEDVNGFVTPIQCQISAGGEYNNTSFRLRQGRDAGIMVNADTIAASGLQIRLYIYKQEGVEPSEYKYVVNKQQYSSLRDIFDGYSGNIYGFKFYITGITGAGTITTTFSAPGLVYVTNELSHTVSGLSVSVDNISDLLTKYNLVNVPFVMNKNQRLYSDGTLGTGMSNESYVSDFIAVTPGKKYYYFGSKTSNSYRTIAGYSSNIQSSFVSAFADPITTPGQGDVLTEITIPEGVNYIRVEVITLYGSLMGVYTVPSDIFKKVIVAQLGGYNIWVGTQTEYDNIQSPDNNTLYFIEQ